MNDIKIQDDGVTPVDKLPVTITVTQDVVVTLESLQATLASKQGFLDDAKAQVVKAQADYDTVASQIAQIQAQLPIRSQPLTP